MIPSKNSLPEPLVNEEPEEGGGEIIGSNITVPDGRYELRYMYYETGYFKDQPKVTVFCAIIEPEDYAGVPVERFYNVDELKGPPRRFGNFRVSARRTLVREQGLLQGSPNRLDRISFAGLRGKRIIGELETVTNDYKRKQLLPDDQYSRIARFVEVLPNEDW